MHDELQRLLNQRPGSLHGAHAVAERIAARDLNNLYLTSCFFRDVARYEAFCAFYAIMRVVDDRIDALPRGERRLPETALAAEHDVVRAWEEALGSCFERIDVDRAVLARLQLDDAPRLLGAFRESDAAFEVPRVLWSGFFRAMRRDIDRPRFADWVDFLDYTEGASVAPTTIYLYLIAADPSPAGLAGHPGFDLLGCGRHLGRFAYVGHVLRDLARDLENGHFFFSGADMESHGVEERALLDEASRRRAGPATRSLVAELVGRARGELDGGRRCLEGLGPRLPPDRRFVLELIVEIYRRILDRVERAGHDPFAVPASTVEERESLAVEIAARVGL